MPRKLIFICHKRPELDAKQFAAEWAGARHAAIVETIPGLTRYVHNYVGPSDNPDAPDGIGELWFDTDEALEKASSSPEMAAEAQGATVDDVLFAPSPATTVERAYVALSRGRHSNHIYAIRDTGWQQAMTESRAHTLATRQHPEDREVRQRLLDRQRDPNRHRQTPRREHEQARSRNRDHEQDRGRDRDRGVGIEISI